MRTRHLPQAVLLVSATTFLGCGGTQPGSSGQEVEVVQNALTLGGGVQFTDNGTELRLTGDKVWVRMTNSGVFEVGRTGRTGFLMQYGDDDSPDSKHFGLMRGTDSDTGKKAFGMLPTPTGRGNTPTTNGGCAYYVFQNLVGQTGAEQYQSHVSLTWTVCVTGGSDEIAVSVKANGEGPKQADGYTLETLNFPAAPTLRSTGKGYAVVPRMEGYILPVGWISNSSEQVWENYDHSELPAQSRDWNMPFYGVVEEDGRALYVEVKDAADSLLVVRNPQASAPRVSVRLNSSLGVFGSAERRMVYVPLDGATYVTLAQRYRSSAQRNGKLTTLATKMGPVPDVARLIGGALVRTTAMTNNVHSGAVGPVPPGVPLSLDEIQKSVQDLAAAPDYPINRGVLHLNGWGQRGFDNLHPDVILPSAQCNSTTSDCGPNAAIGGYAALQRLVNNSKTATTLLVEPHDNYHDFYFDAPTYGTHPEYARVDRNGSTSLVDAWDGGPQTFLCSAKARPLLWRTLDALKAKGIVPNAYYIDVISAAAPDECYNSSFPVTRSQTLGYWSGLLDELVTNQRMVAASEEPVDWSARFVDHVHWTSHVRATRRSDDVEARPLGVYGFNTPIGVPVPLWSLVYHDAVVTPFPFTSGERFEGAFDAWESGGAPMIELNDSIFAGVRRAAARQMQLHATVAKEPLVSHRFVDSGDRFMVAQSQFGTAHTTLVNRTVGAMSGGGLPGTLNTASQTAATYPIRVEATVASIVPVPRTPTPGCADGLGTFHADWVPVSIPTRWQSDSDMLAKDRPLVRIAHVERWFDANGAANGQSEILVNGDEQKMTTSWPVGGTVNDTIKFCVDPATRVGDYPLLVGLYDPSTAWRSLGRLPLPTTRGDHMVEIGTFTITDNAFSFTKQIKGEARAVLARATGGANVELMTEWLLGPWIPANEDVLLEVADAGTDGIVASKRYTPATTPSSWPTFSRWREQRQSLALPMKGHQAMYTVRTGLINQNNVLLGLSSADVATRKVKLGTLIVTDNGSAITQLRFWPTGSCMRRQPHENRAEHWGEIGLNPLGGPSVGSSWTTAWGDPSVDAHHDLLHLSFDDVVRREPFLLGPNAGDNSNVVSFQVTLTGNITFLVQPFNPAISGPTSQVFPALRHANGQIQLGGIRYGMGESFGSFGAFNGQSLPDRNSLRVTVFTRGNSELAMRVDDGRRVYDSKFQSVGDTLERMQFVGDNAAGDQTGSIDVSPVDGCVGLSSDLVNAAFAR